MGGCTSNARDETVIVKKYDFNENHTKHFEAGEKNYMFNRDDK
jgi:hypothetical protein